jgi:YD repeat-containing protein
VLHEVDGGQGMKDSLQIMPSFDRPPGHAEFLRADDCDVPLECRLQVHLLAGDRCENHRFDPARWVVKPLFEFIRPACGLVDLAHCFLVGALDQEKRSPSCRGLVERKDVGPSLRRLFAEPSHSQPGDGQQARYAHLEFVNVIQSPGRTVSYSYDTCGTGLLCSVTDANGGVWKYTYDANNNMTSITDPRNITYLQNQFDSNNRVSKQTQADGGTYQFSYTTDSGNNVTETDVTDPNGNVRKITFNPPPVFPDSFAMGGFSSADTYAAGTSVAQTTSYQYQSGTNLLTSVTDPLARVTAYTYDSLGNTTSVTRLSGTSNAVTTSFTYDPTYNRLTSVTDPLNHATTFTLDSNGNVVSVTDPLSNTSTFANDSEGRVVSASDPLGETTQFGYDGPDLALVTDPLGRTTQFLTDAAGRLVSLIDPLGHVTRYQYNALNQITSITDPLGGVTSFTYDGNGNLLSVTDPEHLQNPTTYLYDSMDRLQTRTDPLGSSESYQYDGNGNLTQFTDRRGVVTTYTYDPLNRLTFAGFGTQSGPTYESTINYSYDAGNRLT